MIVSTIAGIVIGIVIESVFHKFLAKRRERHKKQQSRKFRWWELT